jgi:hypothetical protein
MPRWKPRTLHERFLEKVEMVTESGCWIWTGGNDGRGGYGKFSANGEAHYAHRFSFEAFREPIPPGLEIDHLCRVRCCVNPHHLDVVTTRENCLRGVSPAAIHARKTHCPRGHEYNDINTYVLDGKRQCKPCAIINQRIRRARRRINEI